MALMTTSSLWRVPAELFNTSLHRYVALGSRIKVICFGLRLSVTFGKLLGTESFVNTMILRCRMAEVATDSCCCTGPARPGPRPRA